MLFNSYGFVFVFLPATIAGYFLICRARHAFAAQLWLVTASFVFYAYWNPIYLPLLMASIGFNYCISQIIFADGKNQRARIGLFAGIFVNLLLLGYFKYTNFFLQNLGAAAGANPALINITLPLGISFFTFTQIAFLVDTYRHRASRPGVVNYALFVSYFPHLLAGPILHHREMMPQFDERSNHRLIPDNFARGFLLFALGLGKKVLLADQLAEIANAGFSQPAHMALVDAWCVSLAYSLQLYFDFSGYTDMAIGMSRMVNIRLPANFDVPYRALSIREFWRRWHMTLSRFLREYLYVPLGGNQRGDLITARNVMITFLLGGLWHGAGWTFLVWGALHGAALVAGRTWRNMGLVLPNGMSWALTFLFINVTWVYFRAASLADAHALLEGMAGMRGIGTVAAGGRDIVLLALGLALSLTRRKAADIAESFQYSTRAALALGVLFATCVLGLTNASPFLYFNF